MLGELFLSMVFCKPEKIQMPKYGAAIPPLKLCENHYNRKAVVLIENGAADYLVTNESKERFYAEMNEAEVDWNFHDHSGTPHGFALPPR